MQKKYESWSISDLVRRIDEIEFPEFQREPTVWSLEKKKRLIDSILRDFDISLIYFAKNEQGTFDCIDGRQRINAILSYLGLNKEDNDHNSFNLDMDNEVYEDGDTWKAVQGKRYQSLEPGYKDKISGYKLNIMVVDPGDPPEELNLMFMRLQLGAPLRGGEKLHAMSGEMKRFVFETLSQHEYFKKLSIPARRFAKELVASQLLLNAHAYRVDEYLRRSRFDDLQAFFRKHQKLTLEDKALNSEIMQALDKIVERMGSNLSLIRNRGFAVSAFLFIWSELISHDRTDDIEKFGIFLDNLTKALKWQARKAKDMVSDPEYRQLLGFQSSLSQATGEASSFDFRQAFLADYFDYFLEKEKIKGDIEYKDRTGSDPETERELA